MQLALDCDQLEKAEQLAVLFGLNMQHLLEAAADQKLEEKQFSHAITLYRLSRVHKNSLTFYLKYIIGTCVCSVGSSKVP